MILNLSLSFFICFPFISLYTGHQWSMGSFWSPRRTEEEGYRICTRVTDITWETSWREEVFRRRETRISGFSCGLDTLWAKCNGRSWGNEVAWSWEVSINPQMDSEFYGYRTHQSMPSSKRKGFEVFPRLLEELQRAIKNGSGLVLLPRE